jgi:hypothetical protein
MGAQIKGLNAATAPEKRGCSEEHPQLRRNAYSKITTNAPADTARKSLHGLAVKGKVETLLLLVLGHP